MPENIPKKAQVPNWRKSPGLRLIYFLRMSQQKRGYQDEAAGAS
ncbi:MAG: hypothetical protein ROO73_05595 [Roseivirga sp.]